MNRLALYVFWEKDGIVRDYVTYYLNALKEVAQDIIVIVNGKLSAEGRKKLEELGADILVRENEGLDFAAWKAALEDIGWDKLSLYDELILCNSSCYGPVYPFPKRSGPWKRVNATSGAWPGTRKQHDVSFRMTRNAVLKSISSLFLWCSAKKSSPVSISAAGGKNLIPQRALWRRLIILK